MGLQSLVAGERYIEGGERGCGLHIFFRPVGLDKDWANAVCTKLIYYEHGGKCCIHLQLIFFFSKSQVT